MDPLFLKTSKELPYDLSILDRSGELDDAMTFMVAKASALGALADKYRGGFNHLTDLFLPMVGHASR